MEKAKNSGKYKTSFITVLSCILLLNVPAADLPFKMKLTSFASKYLENVYKMMHENDVIRNLEKSHWLKAGI